MEQKVEMLWKKRYDFRNSECRDVKFWKGNIFCISSCLDSADLSLARENSVVAVDSFDGTIKWRYAPKGDIIGYCFSEDVLAVVVCSKEGEDKYRSIVCGLSPDGKCLWEYSVENVCGKLCVDILNNRMAVGLFYDGFVFLLEWDNNAIKWNLKWKYDCRKDALYQPPSEWATVWDVKINNENIFAISESYVYCFDINGNVEWKTKTHGQERIMPIDKDHILGIFAPFLICYCPKGIAWEFSKDGVIIDGGVSRYNDRICVSATYQSATEDENNNSVIYVLDTNGKIINRFFIEPHQFIRVGSRYEEWVFATMTDRHIYVGTFAGYVYLFDINGNLEWYWHSHEIDEKWRKEHISKESNVVSYIEGEIYGDVYGDYYPIRSLDILNNNIAVLDRNNEIALLKIKE